MYATHTLWNNMALDIPLLSFDYIWSKLEVDSVNIYVIYCLYKIELCQLFLYVWSY